MGGGSVIGCPLIGVQNFLLALCVEQQIPTLPSYHTTPAFCSAQRGPQASELSFCFTHCLLSLLCLCLRLPACHACSLLHSLPLTI